MSARRTKRIDGRYNVALTVETADGAKRSSTKTLCAGLTLRRSGLNDQWF